MNLRKILASFLLLGFILAPVVSKAATVDSLLDSLSRQVSQLSTMVANLRASQLGATVMGGPSTNNQTALPSVSNVTIDFPAAAGGANVWTAGTTHNVSWTTANFSNYPNIPTVSLNICNLEGTVCWPWSGVIGNSSDEQIPYGLQTINRLMGPRLYQRLHDGERMGLLSIFSGQTEPFRAKIRICPTYGPGVYGVRAGAPTNLNSCSFSPIFTVGNPNDTSSNIVKAFPVLNPSTDWLITGPMRSLIWNKDAFPGVAYVEIWMCPASVTAYSDVSCVRSYTGTDAPNTGSRMIGLPYNDSRLVAGAWKIFVRGLSEGINAGADFSANVNLVNTESPAPGANWSEWGACEVRSCGLILNQTRTCTGAGCTVATERRICGYNPCPRTERHSSSKFDSWDIPEKMNPGEEKTITVKMRNTSDIPWPNQSLMNTSPVASQYAFRLAFVEPSNYDSGKVWSNSGSLSLINYTAPDGVGTFTGTIKAPATPGVYKIAFQMYQKGPGLGLFGEKTETKNVTVGNIENQTAPTTTPAIQGPEPELIVGYVNSKTGQPAILTDRDGGYQVTVVNPADSCRVSSGRIMGIYVKKNADLVDASTNTYTLRSKEDSRYPYDFFPKKGGLSQDTVTLVCEGYTPKSVTVKVKPTIKSFSVKFGKTAGIIDRTKIDYTWRTTSGAKDGNPDGSLFCNIAQNNKYYENNLNNLVASRTTTIGASNNQGGNINGATQFKEERGPCKGNIVGRRQYCTFDATITCTSSNGLTSDPKRATWNLDFAAGYY